MGAASKKKGNRVELEFAKLFTERFKEPFKRVPMSGGFGTRVANEAVDNEVKEILTGDLICPKWFIYTVEVKSRVDFNFWDMLNRETKNEIDNWIEQAEHEAIITNKQWIVIVKINNRKPFVIMKTTRGFHYDLCYRKILKDNCLINGYYGIIRWDYFLKMPDEFFGKKER